MEGSIKRAEKLIHATNSALAQMKQNLTFDNVKEPPVKLGRSKVSQIDRDKKSFCFERDLDEFEREFRADANEMLKKMDKILEPNNFVSSRYSSVQASKAREKMKEINRILASRRSEFSQSRETEQSRQKFLNLINNEITTPSPERASSGKSFDASKKTLPRGNLQAKLDTTKKKETVSQKNKVDKPTVVVDKPKEELKIKLLETQEIVNRGFQTAKQLSHRVDHMARGVEPKKFEKTPSSGKTAASDVMSGYDLNRSQKSESNETLKTACSTEKCPKCQEMKEKNKREEVKTVKNVEKEKKLINLENFVTGGEEKNRLVKVKRKETKKVKDMSKLRLQRLPSVHIRGSLQMQRVHSLCLPADNQQKSVPKTNTSIKILSHESIELEKKKNFIENAQNKNCVCESNNNEKVNYIECFNCGKLIKIHETKINPKEIDNLLFECDFNVFDPRIDEFVEKCKVTAKTPEARKERIDRFDKVEEIKVEEIIKDEKEKRPENVRTVKDKRNLKIQELSKRLTQKYREEVDQLEDYQENFDKILKSLFEKIDNSRKLFEFDFKSSSFEKQMEIERKKSNLSISKPFLICLKDEFEEFEEKKEWEIKTKEEKATETDKILNEKHLKRRQRRKKLDKKVVENKFESKVLESVFHHRGIGLVKENFGKKKNTRSRSLRFLQSVLKNTTDTSLNHFSREMETMSEDNKVERIKNNVNKHDYNVEDENHPDNVPRSNVGKMEELDMSSPGNIVNGPACENQISSVQLKTDNDYESDFEGESPTFKNGNGEKAGDEEKGLEIGVMKNLSTISEIDSESGKWTEKSSSGDEKRKKRNVADGINISEPNHKTEYDIQGNLSDKKYAWKNQSEFLEAMQTKAPEVWSPSTLLCERPRDAVASEVLLQAASPISLSDHQKCLKNQVDASLSNKSSSTEVITSLKEVLSALKNQFERTQSLADKLTDNAKIFKAENVKPEPETAFTRNLALVPPLTPELYKQRNLEGDTASLKQNKKKSPFTLLQPSIDSAKSDSSHKNSFIPLKTKDFEKKEKLSHENELIAIEEVRSNDSRTEPNSVVIEGGKSETCVRADSAWVNKSPTASPPSEMASKKAGDDSISEGEIVSSIVLNEEIEGGAVGCSLQSINELISESISEVSRTSDHNWPSH